MVPQLLFGILPAVVVTGSLTPGLFFSPGTEKPLGRTLYIAHSTPHVLPYSATTTTRWFTDEFLFRRNKWTTIPFATLPLHSDATTDTVRFVLLYPDFLCGSLYLVYPHGWAPRWPFLLSGDITTVWCVLGFKPPCWWVCLNSTISP